MTRSWTGIGLFALAALGGTASGDIVDLVNNQFGFINTARFERADFRPAGTGFINSFVRISGNTAVVQGYNTSGRPVGFNENNSPQFTRDITFGMVPQIVVDNVTYLEFFLDINQQSANPLLSLDDVQIYTSSTPGQNTTNLASLGTLVYEMDARADNWVNMDYNLNSGGGQGDMRMLVPASLFGNTAGNTFLYLYSRFGENHSNNDGFEEWAIREGSPIIPLPPAALIGCVGLLSAGIARRVVRPR